MKLPAPDKHTNREATRLVEYDPQWPSAFEAEKRRLLSLLPPNLTLRIEHFGSTAVPGMIAKPVIDILIRVESNDQAKAQVPPILEPLGYEFYWRPTTGEENACYCWFIKRNARGKRTHHLHFVEGTSSMWRRLKFRDYLKEFPEIARSYETLKIYFSRKYPEDRSAYTHGKTEFVQAITTRAMARYGKI